MLCAMNLSDHVKQQGGTGTIGCSVLAELAHKAECSAATLYMIARRHKSPGPKLARRISDATHGAVTLHELRSDIFPAPTAQQGEAA